MHTSLTPGHEHGSELSSEDNSAVHLRDMAPGYFPGAVSTLLISVKWQRVVANDGMQMYTICVCASAAALLLSGFRVSRTSATLLCEDLYPSNFCIPNIPTTSKNPGPRKFAKSFV